MAVSTAIAAAASTVHETCAGIRHVCDVVLKPAVRVKINFYVLLVRNGSLVETRA